MSKKIFVNNMEVGRPSRNLPGESAKKPRKMQSE
jgi:hypothetical protein